MIFFIAQSRRLSPFRFINARNLMKKLTDESIFVDLEPVNNARIRIPIYWVYRERPLPMRLFS